MNPGTQTCFPELVKFLLSFFRPEAAVVKAALPVYLFSSTFQVFFVI